MRENDGRKLDHRTLEALRLRAVDQVAQGAHPEDVAAALGMHRKTVYGWLAKARSGGREALSAKPVPGRPSKLSGAQMRRIYDLVMGSDPRQLEFEFALWTREMIRELIRREARTSSKPLPSRPFAACSACRTSSQDPSQTPTWPTSPRPPDHSSPELRVDLLTNSLVSRAISDRVHAGEGGPTQAAGRRAARPTTRGGGVVCGRRREARGYSRWRNRG